MVKIRMAVVLYKVMAYVVLNSKRGGDPFLCLPFLQDIKGRKSMVVNLERDDAIYILHKLSASHGWYNPKDIVFRAACLIQKTFSLNIYSSFEQVRDHWKSRGGGGRGHTEYLTYKQFVLGYHDNGG